MEVRGIVGAPGGSRLQNRIHQKEEDRQIEEMHAIEHRNYRTEHLDSEVDGTLAHMLVKRVCAR